MSGETNKRGISRRHFLTGAGTAGAAIMLGSALAGCTSGDAGPKTSNVIAESELDTVTQRLVDRGIAGASLPDAMPIAPVEAPDSWNEECDVVIVGLGGAGLVAASYLAKQGVKTIGIDKENSTGGASRHAGGLANPYGMTKMQDEAGFPGLAGGDLRASMGHWQSLNAWSVDQTLLRGLMAIGPEAVEWIVTQDGVPLKCMGAYFGNEKYIENDYYDVMGMSDIMDAFEANAIADGADLRTGTACKALVFDGDRVLGIVAASTGSSDDRYIKANRGVLLCAGGIGMNKDLMKAYLPSAYEGAVQGGPMPSHTGEAFRMGLGVGADFSGYDSWSCWEGAIDEEIAGGDGDFWHYFWHGERQLFHNPWLVIDKLGNRQPYYALTQESWMPLAPGLQNGDLSTTNQWMSVVGHHAYSICDSKFSEEIFKKNTCLPEIQDKTAFPLRKMRAYPTRL